MLMQLHMCNSAVVAPLLLSCVNQVEHVGGLPTAQPSKF